MRRILLCLVLAMCAALSAPAGAGAAFGLHDFDVAFTGPRAVLDEADAPLGPIVSQAGSHPFEMTTSFGVNGEPSGQGGEFVDEPLRDALFTQMNGFAANPRVVPTCSSADFLTPNPANVTQPNCPDASAVGIVGAQLSSEISEGFLYGPVYNIEASPGKAGKLGFWITKVPVTVDAELSEEAPYPIVAGLTNTSQVLEVIGSVFTLWGVPADPRHDALRGACINVLGESTDECSASVGETPFITLPRACTGPLATTYFVRSWLDSVEEGFAETHDEVGNPAGMTGCGALAFSPHLEAAPTSRTAAGPAGMDVDLHLEDEGLLNPSGIAGSDIDKAVVTFPEGVTLNPSQAEGLAVCSLGQVEKETASSEFGAGCPPESKVGSVEAETPLLEGDVLRGSLFVAKPYENPFGSLIAVYMTVKDPELGIGILLAGKVEPDPVTGQLVASFGDPQSPLPAAPVSDFRVHLRAGGRAPLITPSLCGEYTTEMLLTPSADPGHPQLATSSFHIGAGVGGGPCPLGGTPPFVPGFEAGTLSNGAGTHSPFTMRLTRRDGDQDLTKFAATLPRGVLASLVGVAKCSDAAIAAARARTGPHGGAEELTDPSCKADSKIGTSLAGAGVGEQLTFVPGSLYLAGPYNGAPLSVVSITPGVAGPFDVGTIVVRVALGFDSRTGQAKADGSRSDPIPHILRGIPLAVRDVRVSVDRPSWIFNPTSCRQGSTDASIFGSAAALFDPSDDSPVSRSAPFRAADCLELPFGPQMALKLRGGNRRGDHPALTATYTARPGHANVRNLSLLLPRSAFVENANFRTICTRKEFAANHCPPGSVYGHVTASTPLLEEQLSGPVYLRSSDNQLPDAVLVLHGIIDVEVPVRIDSFKQRLRATVEEAPDAAVSKVVVQMQGGRKGLFVNSRNLCVGNNRAQVDLTAQSNKRLTRRPLVKSGGCKGKKRRSSSRTGA
jgi:hypothetical protein